MSVLHTLQALRNSKKYEMIANIRMSENDGSQTNALPKTNASNAAFASETGILTQKEVDEQITNYIAPMTRQLENLTRLILDMSTAHRKNLSPRAGTSGNSSTAGPSPNLVIGDIGTLPDTKTK